MSALRSKLLRDLWRIRSQVLAVALVMASGIGLLVMSLASIESLSETMTAYYERNQFGDVFASVERAPERLAVRIAELPGVQQVETRISELATLDIEGFGEPVVARLVSVPDRGQPLLNILSIREGRYIAPGRADEIVLSEPFAQAHKLRPGDSVRAILNGRQRSLQVVGTALSPEFVYTIGPGSLMPDDHRFGVFWIGREALAAAYDFESAFNDVSVSLLPGVDASSVITALDSLLYDYGGIGAYDRSDHPSHWFVSNEIDQLRNLARILPTIFLAVAAYLTNMVLARLVATERAEIGLLKAFGYSDRAVAAHYLAFATAIVAVGVIIGWPTGYWLGRFSTGIYAENYHFPFLFYEPSAGPFMIGAGICLLTALAGALGAVRRAASLPPAEAMRPPAPALFGGGFGGGSRAFSRLVGRFDQLSAIIVRQITRWLLRAGMTVFGLAMAIALCILALQWPDAINHLIDSTYFRDQRQDVTVTLAQARAGTVVHDFAHLPGVRAVDPRRVSEARVRFGHRERRVSIEGVPQDAWLEVVRDARGAVLDIPEQGLVLSEKLAEVLGVARGDVLEVELLDGQRRVRQIAVASVYSSFVGMRVLMHIDTLSRALGHGPSVNSAHLHVEPRQLDALLQRLKTLPMAQGVMLRLASVRLFQQTMARIINVYVAFYVGFACVLAFGVAYNSARVALSERGHELATLQVLGFDRADASYVLLGELGLLLVAALPVGCVLGYGLSSLLASAFETELFRIPLVIEDSTYGMAVAVVVLAALISGLIVKRQIQRLELTLALKSRQ